MTNENYSAGRAVLKTLVASEADIDTSLVKNAKLIISILEARETIGATRTVGHAAIMSAVSAQSALAAARDHTLSCHEKLVEARDELGLSPRALGCTSDCLPPLSAQAAPHLSVVA